MKILQEISNYFTSGYLKIWWYLAVGYLGCYAVAWILAHIPRPGTTYLYRCRQAWGLAFLAHGLFVVGFTIYWWQLYSTSMRFQGYIPLYCLLVIGDLVMAGKLFAGIGKFKVYRA